MSFMVKGNQKLAITKEVTEGLYVAPSASTDFLEVQEGIELKTAIETLDLKVIGLGLSKKAPRQGLKSVSGSISSYMKAGSASNSACESDLLLECLFGSKKATASKTSTTGNTSSVINFASTTGLAVGDIVVVKEAGAYHTSPIASIVVDTSITLLIAGVGAFSNAVVVDAFTSYGLTNTGHSSLSISKYSEDAVLESASGVKVTSMSVESFETAKNALFKWGFEGAKFDRSLTAPPVAPTYDSSNTPVILNACLYLDGVEVKINNFSLSVDNKLGLLKNTCDGVTGSRVVERTVKGSINPYKDSASLAFFNNFVNGTAFSLFISASNATGVTGEFKEVVSFYLPLCITTGLNEADQDGVLQEVIEFSCTATAAMKELFISIG
jgi:hypothetical protein